MAGCLPATWGLPTHSWEPLPDKRTQSLQGQLPPPHRPRSPSCRGAERQNWAPQVRSSPELQNGRGRQWGDRPIRLVLEQGWLQPGGAVGWAISWSQNHFYPSPMAAWGESLPLLSPVGESPLLLVLQAGPGRRTLEELFTLNQPGLCPSLPDPSAQCGLQSSPVSSSCFG